MQQPSKHLHADDPAIAGLLTPGELDNIQRIIAGLDKITDAIYRVNDLIRGTHFDDVRFIPYHVAILAKNDFCRILEKHNQAEKKVVESAVATEGLQK